MEKAETNGRALRLRPMEPGDAQTIHLLNRREGWHSVKETYDAYYAEQQRGGASSLSPNGTAALRGMSPSCRRPRNRPSLQAACR